MNKKVICDQCNATIMVDSYRNFVKCPYCGNEIPFEGFDYVKIDPHSSKYAGVKKWIDCPACRSKHMYLGHSGRGWLCPDCGLRISHLEKMFGVFWFCDKCDAYLNIQEGFTTKNGTWKCTACGHVNGTTKKDIL